jgi:hypothetical protein
MAAVPTKRVVFDGYRLSVPRSWPVYNLSSDASVCVRFNRHAVYLGRPSSAQNCPAHSVGRTEAILVAPPGGGAALPAEGDVASVPVDGHRLLVTATWSREKQLVERALGRRLRAAPPGSGHAAPSARTAAGSRARAHPAVANDVYTGLGFDTCATPTLAQMRAWASTTKYRAIGVYLGGVNSACSSSNLNTAWVNAEVAAGWNLIPTYVGLQAPDGNSCGCNPLDPSKAGAQGTAAANDATSRAQAIGIDPDSPIYFDMEAYSPSKARTSAVLKFLSAWTTQLHAAGYLSGVYSSADAAISDIASATGKTFVPPDDIWIARWNGEKNTAEPVVPSTEFADHQRLHQYSGSHDETHGKVTLNIDGDYLDGATAGIATTPTSPTLSPTVKVSPTPTGGLQISAQWPGQAGVNEWQLLAGNDPNALAPFGPAASGSSSASFTLHSQYAYFAVQALDATGSLLGTSLTAATPPHLAIYGRSAFVPAHGSGGVPVGCFTPTRCHVVTTVSVGRTVIARTPAETIAPNSGGVVHFKLTSTGRSLLAHAPGRRLAVKVTATNAGGPGVSANINLVPFTTTGTGPQRTVVNAPTLKILASTSFAYRNQVGGLFIGCFEVAPCAISATIADGSTTIAQTGSEALGADQLGYLNFHLTAAGRQLLAHARGNQLGARVTVADATAQATGKIVLVGYR